MLGTGNVGNRLWVVAGLVAALALPGVAVAASTITGTIVFNGKPPALKPLSTEAEPTCHKKHGGKPAPNEALVLGSVGAISYVNVNGHTDRLGSPQYNMQLSVRRAETVKAYLVKLGIPAAKVAATVVSSERLSWNRISTSSTRATNI